MTENRGSSVSSFHGRPPPKVTKLRRHTSSESLFSLPRLKARFLNDSGRRNYVHWTADLCPMQRTIKFWNDNTYFIHLQAFPCPLFHPRPNIPYNWQLACYKHTNSLKSCLYVITLHRQHVWLHCSVRVITRGAMITDQVRPHQLASNRRHHATGEHSDRKGSARKMKTMRAKEDQYQFQYMGANRRKWTDFWEKVMSPKIPR